MLLAPVPMSCEMQSPPPSPSWPGRRSWCQAGQPAAAGSEPLSRKEFCKIGHHNMDTEGKVNKKLLAPLAELASRYEPPRCFWVVSPPTPLVQKLVKDSNRTTNPPCPWIQWPRWWRRSCPCRTPPPGTPSSPPWLLLSCEESENECKNKRICTGKLLVAVLIDRNLKNSKINTEVSESEYRH